MAIHSLDTGHKMPRVLLFSAGVSIMTSSLLEQNKSIRRRKNSLLELLRSSKNWRNTPVPQSTSSISTTHSNSPNKTECPCLKCYFQAICEKLPKKAVHGRHIAFRVHTAPNSPLRTQRITPDAFILIVLLFALKLFLLCP